MISKRLIKAATHSASRCSPALGLSYKLAASRSWSRSSASVKGLKGASLQAAAHATETSLSPIQLREVHRNSAAVHSFSLNGVSFDGRQAVLANARNGSRSFISQARAAANQNIACVMTTYLLCSAFNLIRQETL